jgi:hypothetical protein
MLVKGGVAGCDAVYITDCRSPKDCRILLTTELKASALQRKKYQSIFQSKVPEANGARQKTMELLSGEFSNLLFWV